PAIAHGVSDYIGSIEVGKMADIVLWDPKLFGTKPEMVIKNGMGAQSLMGDPNATIPTPQPMKYRNMLATRGKGDSNSSVTCVSQAAIDNDIKGKLGLEKIILPVKNIRQLTKKDTKFNTATPNIDVER